MVTLAGKMPQLEITTECRATAWKKFQRHFVTFVNAYYSEKADSVKIAMLLNAGGDYLMDIFDSLQITDTKLSEVLKKLRR